ncbi:MAG: BamA/TamA family outer membrane protein [Saprospiraceae bacterium]|nr:BamA/TamA family outer membrane protein [Saprospiraceae bacterium]
MYIRLNIFFLILTLSVLLLDHLSGQSDTTEVSDGIKPFIAGYPIVFYLPETRLGFGGAGVLTYEFDNPNALASNIILGGAYTLNDQVLSYLTATIYWDRHQIDAELGYYDYFYPYYGVGPRTSLGDKENYSVRFPRIKAKYYYEAAPRLYLGGQLHFDYYDITDIEVGGLIDENQEQFKEGGSISGIGVNFQRDRRDNIFFPTKGELLEFNLMVYNDTWGSRYDFITSDVTLTQYYTVHPFHHLALMAYLSSTVGDVPFQELSLYGGPNLARGYVRGRYRDRTMALLQLEYRFPIYSRFRGVAFTSVGNVGPDVAKLFDAVKFNYGVGLRFLLSKDDRIYLRLDYGRSFEGGEFYLTIGEAF